jgi:AcrR family transcriptional regulator
MIRQRAMQAEDKQERRDAILDAAERMLLRSQDHVANVAEVADEAGLAKGTVYLYFPSKEELLLALHERNIDGFFNALVMLLARTRPVKIDDVLALTHKHMVDPPLFLPLATRCFAHMSQSVPAQAGMAFKQRLGDRLARAGAGLERHFRDLPAGGGVVLLRHSYALILGLWQLSAAQRCPAAAQPKLAVFNWSYADSVDAALRALWQGTVRPRVAALRRAS